MRIFFIFLLLPTVIFAQKNVSDNLEKYMQAQVDINNFSGTVLVTKKGSVLLKKSYGLADYEWNIKNTTDTKYSLASVSKQFTAVAILQLVNNNQLSLDDKLSKFFPTFPKGDSITIHTLLCHMSGLQMDFDELYLNNVSITQDSVLKYIAQKNLLFSPKTNTAYSNIGYYLLARIIEKISGQSYAKYLKTNIFEKVKMNNTGVITNDELINKRAKNYIFIDNKYIHNPYINWEYNIGHDGIYSTVDDLAIWDKALYGTNILATDMKKRMFTSYNDQHFGYGFMINPFYNQGHQLIAHDGGFFGAQTSFNRFTDDKLLVTVLSNNQSSSYMIAYGLSAIAFGKDVEIPYKHSQIKIDTAICNKYVGKYGQVEILQKDGKLYYNSKEIELIPESKTKFFRADNHDRTIEFIQDKSGKYNAIIFTKAGVKEVIKKNTE
ncbi:CubicO group peptidase, beta-lactamase class C family [Flexibacter flexilis DSM 6793]|uniref:CubicO group peptidase, beta-lactamase class C family n=1 Tax=Flexibacter flexilis DSM 6793 TaxID=927664 RepID=A0A1I1J861_9BACT|nr:serine hydrolase domain-containing protein [Flexibacter flexilis]SFC44809.1 CubicO group peptidase, beta-lactamase class C family [Flexibacter flexilis DSM 6793]